MRPCEMERMTGTPMDVMQNSLSVPEESSVPNPIILLPESSSLHVAADKVPVSVEVCLYPSSTALIADVREAVERMLEQRSLSYVDGPVPVPLDDSFLLENVKRIQICDTDEWVERHEILLFWQVKPVVHVFQTRMKIGDGRGKRGLYFVELDKDSSVLLSSLQFGDKGSFALWHSRLGHMPFKALSEDGPGEELSGDDLLSSFNEWVLPSREFHGMWESLIYEAGLKRRLLRYAASALLFTEKQVDPCLVSWNRIILLHGPPGTGKTSLCKALAQKLSIRFSCRYSQCQLIEVNAHSLFSKWFSESGKLVAKLFQKIQEMVEEENNLVFVLIDEVESLAAARQAALSGSEPSDSIRVVNALLTQMDRLKSWPNVIILTTSNITAAIDIAFVDRADIKAYVGPPTLQARYEILRSCLQELQRTGILADSQDHEHRMLLNYASLREKLNSSEVVEPQSTAYLSRKLLDAATVCEGLSGRALRKLPFLAHAALTNPYDSDSDKFLYTLTETAKRELSELTN